jgi:acyl-homoserine-lactone acylase
MNFRIAPTKGLQPGNQRRSWLGWSGRRDLARQIPLSVSMIALLFACLLVTSVPCCANDLAQKALIRRDTYGIPHILAETEEAAAFAQGYATAEDHFMEMARLFLRARGEQASVYGPKYLNEDIVIHKLGIWETAQERFKELPPLMQMILDGYAGGYNLYLAGQRNQKSAPDWAAPISGVDVLAHCRAVLLLDFSLDLSPWRMPADRVPGFGSNMWAIGRGRSQSGHGLLLANPHLRWGGSHTFHEIQLSVPGKLNISGATLIGFPIVTIGFNDYLGWSHTVNEHHSEAVYELKLNPRNRREYYYEGHLLPLQERPFTVRVKNADSLESKSEIALWSHFGPIIRVSGDRAYAYRSTNLNSINFLTQYNQMAKAKSWKAFRSALDMQELTMFNIGYADRQGNIFYLYNGRIPVRPDGYDWKRAVPGDDSTAEWYTIHPISDLPQLFNPASGYLQNCNDAPWYATTGASIDRTKYPDYDGDKDFGLRGQTSIQMLEATRSMTLEDVKQHKYNESLLLAIRLKPELIALAKQRSDENTSLAEAIAVLQQWDNKASADSRGAMLFVQWWEDYRHKTSSLFKTAWSENRPFDTPSGIGNAEAAVAALLSASATLKDTYSRLDIAWGEVHRLRRGNLDLPAGGMSGMGSFRAIVYRQDKDKKWVAAAGDSYVLAVELADPPVAYSVMAYSESSNPLSKHYSDQLELFARQRYKRVWVSEADIKANLERAYHPGE